VGAEQLPGCTNTAAPLAAAEEARGGEAVSNIASTTTTAAANTATPGIAATTTIPARDALGERAPPDDRGIFLRKEGYPDHPGRMGGA
jgi:hypothetical protein